MKKKKRMPQKRQCDECGVRGTSKTIHGIRTVKHSNDQMRYLCKSCWSREMIWRREKNQVLPKQSRFPIVRWRVS